MQDIKCFEASEHLNRKCFSLYTFSFIYTTLYKVQTVEEKIFIANKLKL